MSKGYLALMFHAHLPYVRHPEHDFFLEEDWLYEAITETYIPLIEVFEGFEKDGVPWNLTMSITPPLAEMLSDPLLQERYIKHLNKLIELSSKEIERTRWQKDFQHLAFMYKDMFIRAREIFENKYHRNILTAFKKFQDSGHLEIITCGATHGYLPLMDINPHAVRAQIKIAARNYEKHFGRRPRGIWLPECGYYPGHDRFLAEEGIKFFFVDTHSILHATPRPKYGVFAPLFTENGVAAFGRDVESSKQVWSAEEGYPGDHYYRDFYRDIGFDLDFDYVKDYISPDGIRKMTGIKYYRITGESEDKAPYEPQIALEKAASHAGNFMFNREKQVEYLYDVLGGKKPMIVSPYDAELYGHWWFEGPKWIDFLVRKIAFDQDTIELTTPMKYLEENSKIQVSTPSMSSWGYKGYHEVWLEGSNDWIYRHLHEAADRMVELAKSRPDSYGIERRALNQAARELVLAQSSDWAFIMKTDTMVPYAIRRTREHIARFTRLYEDIKRGTIDGEWLNDIESKDNIFNEIDYKVYA